MKRHLTSSRAVALMIAALTPALIASPAKSQGCEPIRFTTPVNLGGEGQAYQPGGEWRLALAYRRLESNQWFIGSTDASSRAPGGQSPVIKIHTFVANVAYSVNERISAELSIPISTGSFSRKWADGVVHQQSATGVGDLTLMGETWILTPRSHPRGNIEVGLGVKAPTGSHTIGSQFYTRNSAVDFPADQTIQPGDGGWGLIVQSEGFRQLSERTFAYASGSYMASPKAHTDVPLIPDSTTYWAVPDVYSARLGGAFAVLPDQGLTMSLGGRVDGIPIHDLLGGGDETTIKRTAYVIFAEPGLSLTRGKGTFTLSVPYRLKVNREKSLYEQRTNGTNGGGFAKFLVFASYSHRL
jgi:hypothetical protein